MKSIGHSITIGSIRQENNSEWDREWREREGMGERKRETEMFFTYCR